MRNKKLIAIALLSVTAYTASAQTTPAQIAKQGLDGKIAPCSSCHGQNGGGNPAAGFPRLSGLGETYINEQLNAFADGARKNAVMMPIASALSTNQRMAMSRYYSEQAVQPAKTAAADAEKIPEVGTELAEHGRWADDIPACVQCHGSAGVGVGDRFPALAGQPAAYIEAQLRAWRNGKRPGGPMGLMASVAAKLNDKDIAPVAAYFAAQTPASHKGGDHE